MREILERLGLVTALLLIALPAAAHHSRAMYDHENTVTVDGVVRRYEWANPHIHVYVETRTATADPVVWAFETGTTTMMRTRGWTDDMFTPGDHVIVEGYPIRESGRTTALIASIEKTGEALFAPGDDGPQALAAADSLNGTWEVPLTALVTSFSDPSTWPLTEKGRAAIASYDDRTMNPQIECMSRTAPWVMIFTGVQRIDIGDDLTSIRTEYDTVERTIDMTSTTHVGAGVDHHGHSIGWWQNDVLVVDTTHFSAHRNGNARGVPSGPRKHLVEHFELNDDGAGLTYRFELDDPEHLTAQVSGSVEMTYRPDLEFMPVECDLDNARRFVDDDSLTADPGQ